ncbi:hypothetical protein JCM11491_000369 [Sporobolomyces phaffii]
MADSIQDLFNSIASAWDSVVPAEGLPNLHSLPHQLHDALFAPGGVFDKLTNGGTVPLPVPASWLESASATPPPPPPAPTSLPLSLSSPRWLQDLLAHLARYPYPYALAALSATTGATYYYSPRTLDPLVSLLPAEVLPPRKNRPLRLLPSTHGVPAEVRKEAALVLGADSVQGREIALDLEKRGWVVIATVSDPDMVDKLEREGRGWIKVLVLDPAQSSSVSPFLRSLSTALSLRFPLHTSGDPFSRPSHALALTSLVDCLSLPSSSTPALVPLEAVESEQIRRDLTERISTFILVSKGVLPFLRSSASRPGAPTTVYLLLLPSITSNLSLPFLSLSSTLSQALESLFHSLRRELRLSTPSPNLKLSILQVGSFDVATPSSRLASPPASIPPTPLPIRLSSLYAPALARRAAPPAAPASSPTSFVTRRASRLSHLTSKVALVLVRPSHSYAVSLSGAGSWTYYYVRNWSCWIGAHGVVDVVLTTQDWLLERYQRGVERWQSLGARARGAPAARLGGGGGGARGPLPPTPEVPESLKPQGSATPSQVPLKDSFVSRAREPSQPQSREGYRTEVASEDEDDGTSSIEDLGVSTGSLGGDSIYGTGSFVNV